MNIIGYWHILMINHYADIVTEQLNELVQSELYDNCDEIHIGCLGAYEDMVKLSTIIQPYSKIKISEYSTNKNVYEFQTLNILKDHADGSYENYYLFYIHTKGVSFAENKNKRAFDGGEMWRKFMNENIINRWQDNIAMLELGYETSGTQLRPHREFRQHYSGNFWWATSRYVRLLPPFSAVNLNDRFQAEFWVCSAHPIAATINQTFVDYYTEEKQSTVKPKGRNVVHTLCWNTYDNIERAVESLYVLNDKKDFEHIVVDLDFPLEDATKVPADITESKKNNSKKLKALADKYGSKYVKMKNVGVSQNWTVIAQEEKIGDGDVLICCDADEIVFPQCFGWVKSIGDVIRGDESYGVVSLIMQEQFDVLNDTNSINLVVGDVRVIGIKGNLMMPQIGISGKLIKEMGGIPYPKDYPVYGHLESALLQAMGTKYKWCMLPDFLVAHPEHNPQELLRQYKDIIIHKIKEYGQISFDRFLELKQQGKV